MEASSMLMVKVFLVLFFGAKPAGPAGGGVPLKPIVDRNVPLYAEVDISAVRQLVADTPALGKLLFEGQDPAQAYDEAVTQVAGMINANPDDLKRAAGSLRRAAFWLQTFTDDEEDVRFLAVFDCGDQKDILDALLAGVAEEEDLKSFPYAGQTIYCIGDAEEGVWLTECQGKVAVARDLIAAQQFLLTAPGLRAGREAAARPMLYAEASNGPMMDCLFATIDSWDREEFLMGAYALDLASWKALSASFDGRRVEVKLQLDPNGRYTRTLAGPDHGPNLASAIPESEPISGAVALKDTTAATKAVRQLIEDMMTMSGEDMSFDQIKQEAQREIGLDLDKDVLDNIAEAGFVLTSPGDDQFAILFEVKDAAKAKAAIETLVANVPGELTAGEQDGATVWGADDEEVMMILKGNTFVLGHKETVAGILDCVAGRSPSIAAKLQKQQPKATTFVAVNPFLLAGHEGIQGGTFLIGLSVADNTLTAALDADFGSLADILAEALVAAQTSAASANCMNNIRQVCMACQMYAADNEGVFPPNLDVLVEDYLGDDTILNCPATGEKYIYNKAIAGKNPDKIEDAWQALLVYEEPGAHGDGANVGYADGHVEFLQGDDLLNAIEMAAEVKEGEAEE